MSTFLRWAFSTAQWHCHHFLVSLCALECQFHNFSFYFSLPSSELITLLLLSLVTERQSEENWTSSPISQPLHGLCTRPACPLTVGGAFMILPKLSPPPAYWIPIPCTGVHSRTVYLLCSLHHFFCPLPAVIPIKDNVEKNLLSQARFLQITIYISIASTFLSLIPIQILSYSLFF